MPQAFPPAARLLNEAQYGFVFKQAQKSTDRYFTVLFRSNDAEESRLGLVVAKRHVRLATGRNRVKRQIREAFRHARCTLPTLDIVVLARAGADRASNTELRKSLDKHWSRLATSP